MNHHPFQPLWRKLFTVAALLVSLLLCAAAGQLSDAQAAPSCPEGSTPQQRLDYILSLGWEVHDGERCEEVVLPEVFGSSYDSYLTLQRECGFDLSPYAGQTVQRYCYEVTNYPGGEGTVLLNLLVYQGQIIGGDVRTTALDGFMQSLAFPKA